MSTTTAPHSVTLNAVGDGRLWPAPGRLRTYGLIMVGAFVSYMLSHGIGGEGPVWTALEMVGAGACGWAWLIARALFDPAKRDAWWPRIVAGVVAVTGALSVLSLPGLAGRVIDNSYALSGSAVLLLTFVEPFLRFRDLPAGERRFRFVFVAVYALLVAVSILAPGGAELTPEAARGIALLKSLCALGGLIAGTAAVAFRVRRPLAAEGASRPRRVATEDDERLARRVLDLLDREAVHTEPNLKVADIAARLGQPEYRVSQAVTTVLGFENFNRLINHHRIALAKRLLADAGRRRSILDVAFECGFGSVGPFNRAFKAETGVTPRAFRLACREGMETR